MIQSSKEAKNTKNKKIIISAVIASFLLISSIALYNFIPIKPNPPSTSPSNLVSNNIETTVNTNTDDIISGNALISDTNEESSTQQQLKQNSKKSTNIVLATIEDTTTKEVVTTAKTTTSIAPRD